MDWLSPVAIAATVLVVVLALVVGRFRQDSYRTIVLNAVGYPAFLLGLAWANSLSVQAFYAAAMTSFGVLLFTMAAQRSRPRESVAQA